MWWGKPESELVRPAVRSARVARKIGKMGNVGALVCIRAAMWGSPARSQIRKSVHAHAQLRGRPVSLANKKTGSYGLHVGVVGPGRSQTRTPGRVRSAVWLARVARRQKDRLVYAQRWGWPVSLANARIGTCTLGDGVIPCRSKIDDRCIHTLSGHVVG